VDTHGYVTYANPAFLRLWGFADEREALGVHRDMLWADAATVPDYLEAILADGRPRVIERNGRRIDGRTFQARVQAMPYTDLQGRPLGGLAAIEDVTRERALVQASSAATSGCGSSWRT